MKYILSFCFLLSIFVIKAQHTNIIIHESDYQNEPAIMINPKNTNIMVAGSNITNYYYSNDAGYTWSKDSLTSTYGVWGDPCLIADTAGNFYFFHLSGHYNNQNWLDRIVCQKSSDNGQTWSNGTYAGLDGTKDQDKEWAIVDRQNNNIYMTWTQFDEYDSQTPGDSSNIMFSKSIDAGLNWSNAIRINKIAGDCIDSDNTVEGAVPAVGPNGEIFVSWVGPAGLVFDKSTDQGNSWLENDIFITDVPGGWDFDIPAINRCNGLPVTKCDLSNGPHHGAIYVNWSDQRNGITDTDVWLVKSTDGGSNWSNPIRVNDDPAGKHQFFTWMDIDQTNGFIYFVYYDRRNHNDNYTDVYMAVSKDGGNTFTNFKISENSFLPSSSLFFGDYTNISAHNNVIRPIWFSLHNYYPKTYTAIIDPNAIGIDNTNKIPLSLEQNYPNPFKESTVFSYKIANPSNISLYVVDAFGRKICTLINNKHSSPGKYTHFFNALEYNLKSGMYYFLLVSNNETIMKKMLIAK